MAGPNLVLIVLDAFRYDRLRKEAPRGPLCPNLLRLAEEGVCFDDAISPAGYTVPTHASFFTGERPSEHSMFSHRPIAAPTMGADSLLPLLKEAGYTCVGVSDNPYFDKGNVLGADFDVLISTPRVAEQRRRSGARRARGRQAGLLGRLARILRPSPEGGSPDPGPATHNMTLPALGALLRALPRSGRPVFLYCNLMGTHEPYGFDAADAEFARPPGAPAGLVQPESFHAEYRYHALGIREMSSELRAALTWSYDAAVHSVDRILDGVLAAVRENLGEGATDIVITSDHGEMLGEHGAFGHALRLYEELVHVPMLLVSPEAAPGSREPGTVQTHWLWRYFVERAGLGRSVDVPEGQGSLLGGAGPQEHPTPVALSFSGPDSGWEWLQTAVSVALRDGMEIGAISAVGIDPHLQAVRSSDAALIVNRSGRRSAWRRGRDGSETRLEGEEAAAVEQALSEHLITDFAAPAGGAAGSTPDTGIMDRLRDLGYVD
jgi:hypothetical protein